MISKLPFIIAIGFSALLILMAALGVDEDKSGSNGPKMPTPAAVTATPTCSGQKDLK